MSSTNIGPDGIGRPFDYDPNHRHEWIKEYAPGYRHESEADDFQWRCKVCDETHGMKWCPPVSGEPSSLRYTDAARTRVHEHCGDCSDWACDGFEARATPPDEGRDRLEAALRPDMDVAMLGRAIHRVFRHGVHGPGRDDGDGDLAAAILNEYDELARAALGDG